MQALDVEAISAEMERILRITPLKSADLLYNRFILVHFRPVYDALRRKNAPCFTIFWKNLPAGLPAMLLFALPDRMIAAILLKLIPAGSGEDVQQARK